MRVVFFFFSISFTTEDQVTIFPSTHDVTLVFLVHSSKFLLIGPVYNLKYDL